MSDIRKWLKIMESIPSVFPDQPTPDRVIKQDATVMVDPRVGGGTARYMHSTPNGAMVDVKGIAKELPSDDFGLPERDYEDPYQKGNDWFHMTQEPDSPGRMNDKPELRPGDMIKIADVYGTVIGPGMGVFVAYGTTGKDAVVSFDGKEMLVPVANIAAALEQNSKDNFGEMDNDGNLSPMSFGSENRVKEVHIEKQEPAMDHRDEFSKWMSTVEEAMTGNMPSSVDVGSAMPTMECGGCGNWECADCFPDEHGQEMQMDPEIEVDADPTMVMMPQEGHVCPQCGHSDDGHMHDGEEEFEVSFEDGSAGGMGAGGMASAPIEMEDDESMVGVPEEDPMDEEQEQFIEKGSRGKGVKLGDIVSKTEFRKSGGQNSPLTYGEDNLDEDDMNMDSMDQGINTGEMIINIMNMQNQGLGMHDENYTEEQLSRLSPEQLKQCYDQVMGTMTEAPKPTGMKPKHDMSGFDDMDDILNPSQGNLPANAEPDMDQDMTGEPGAMELPTASAQSTQRATQNVSPSSAMRELMSRMDRSIGDAEPDMPHAENEVVVRTANEVPAVISSAMRASGMHSPEWHRIKNLPGMNDRAIRAMGRGMFGTMTSTPVEDIKTIANVNGQGPNTESEVRAVAGWLKNNAEDLGNVQVSHGAAMPGYEVDAHDFKANGVRFHVVRDQAGTYIYAYPDKDAKVQGQAQGHLGMGGDTPQLGESSKVVYVKPTLFEQLKWDDELAEAFALAEDELDESSLSKLIGKNKGGQQLVRWLHKKHKLSNDAELEPVPFNKELLWSQFKSHPDDFVIVSGQNGAAGIKPDQKHIEKMTAWKKKKGQEYNPGRDATLPYQVIAFTGDGEQVDPELLRPTNEPGDEPTARDPDPTVVKARMGKTIGKDIQNSNNTFSLLNDQIGPLTTVWISGFGGFRGDPESLKEPTGSVERDKMQKRADMKKGSDAGPMEVADSTKKIFDRVRPVLKTLANQAMSQVQRTAKRYMDGGNFEGAQQVMSRAAKLKQFLINLDTSGDVSLDAGAGNNLVLQAMQGAIAQASGAASYSQEYKDFASAAAQGNAQALKPILDGLREKLVSLSDYANHE